jgi:acetyl-CoA carboxylase biotin carboxyl carrier protein
MKTKSKTERSGAAPAAVDLAEVERLLKFMTEHGLEEFEYSRGDLRIRLRKPAVAGVTLSRHTVAPEIVAAPEAPSRNFGTAPTAEATAEAEATARSEDLHTIKSPIVGTFYASPSPGAEAFVKLGDKVNVGQVLCIIEAMKLMNEIESDAAGEIVRIYVENGQPVEYGQPLFAIRPTRKK